MQGEKSYQDHTTTQVFNLDDILDATVEARATVKVAPENSKAETSDLLEQILSAKQEVTDCLNGMTVEDFVQAYKKIGYKPRQGLFEHAKDTQCCGLQAYQNATGRKFSSLFGQDVITGFIAGFDGGLPPGPKANECQKQGYNLGRAVWNAVKDFPGGIRVPTSSGRDLVFKTKKLA